MICCSSLHTVIIVSYSGSHFRYVRPSGVNVLHDDLRTVRINPKKTKIMIFQRCNKKCDYVFHIDNETIDIVQDYTYLGTRISVSGNFTLSLEHLRQNALHAFFSQDATLILVN